MMKQWDSIQVHFSDSIPMHQTDKAATRKVSLSDREAENMVECPRCGKEGKDTYKEWDYSAFHVKQFNCTNCGKTFKAYYRDKGLSHTIPKRNKARAFGIDQMNLS
jgi:predicted RNA-binding Zn-ribbon protein involved in translation (DUF1610 family)